LEFSSCQNDLNDFLFGLVGEKLVEVGLLGDCAVRCVLVDFLGLQNFREILFDTISPVERLVSITGDLEVSVVDFVSDGGHISQLDVHYGLFQHVFGLIFSKEQNNLYN